MNRFIHVHGDLLIGALGLAVAVFMSCVLGPTLDAESTIQTAQDAGSKTAYASKD